MRKPRPSRGSSSAARLDRQAWIDAAYGVLVREGVEQVRVLSLARRLGVTRGSFYWHFKSRGQLLEDLVELWRRKNTRAVVDAVRRPAKDLPERFLHIARCWFDQSIYDPRLDIAFRDWARRDRRILGLVREADEARIAAFAQLFQAEGETERMALVRARIVYYMQMGYYIIGVREALAYRVGFFREYYEAFTGQRLSKRRSRQIEAQLLAPKQDS
jgi:AcrR family transcriptional regulator